MVIRTGRPATSRKNQEVPVLMLASVVAPCLLLCWQSEAAALSLLSIRDLSQSVGFSYTLARSASSANSAPADITQEFTEDYGLSFDYSVLTKELLSGKSMLDLEWLQNREDVDGVKSGGSNFQLRYNVFGQLLSRTPIPIALSTSSTRETVSQPFVPSYQSETQMLTARISLQNAMIPANMDFTSQSQETTGLRQDTTQKSQNLSVSARPSLGDFGNLNLGVSLSEGDSSILQTGQTSHSASASAQAGYRVAWKTARSLSRAASLTYGYQQTAGTTDFESDLLNGNVFWQFGEALDGVISAYSSSSSAAEAFSESRGGAVSMKHTLMGSLTTSVALSGSQEDFSDGGNNQENLSVGLRYNKKLPEASHLNVSYFYSLARTEHTGEASSVEALNESHDIPPGALRLIRLNHRSFVGSSVEVVGRQSQLAYPASFYTITAEGIVLLDSFPADSAVLVNYTYLQDPSVTTLGTAHSVAASVSLFGSKYRIYTNARFANQKQVEGEATALSLTGTRHYDLGAVATLPQHNLSAEIGYDKDYALDLYYFTASWGHTKPHLSGLLSLNANERFTFQSSDGGDSPWSNSVGVQGNYRRSFRFITSSLRADYANIMIEGGDMFHSATVGANIEGQYGRLSAILNTSASWNFSGSASTSSQAIGISVRRSF